MPGPTVTVDLKVRKKGAITISVDPWEVHCALGETVQWNFTGDVTSGSVSPEYKSRVWPFAGPNPPLKGTKKKNARTGKRTRRTLTAKVVPYRVTMQFKDPTDQHLRSASVDPDMVIDGS